MHTIKAIFIAIFDALKVLDLRVFFQVFRYFHITTVWDLLKVMFFIVLIHSSIAFYMSRIHMSKIFVKISAYSALFMIFITTLMHVVIYFSNWTSIKEAVLAPSYQLLFIIVIFVNTINLLKLMAAYNQEMGLKKSDPDHVTRAHFATTLNTTVLLIVLTIGMVVLASFNVGVEAFAILVLSTGCIWFNHWLARRYIRE